MESESYLCLGSGIFTEGCGPVLMSSQASRNKCLGIPSKSHMARSQGSCESVVLENVQFMRTLSGHFLDVIF